VLSSAEERKSVYSIVEISPPLKLQETICSLVFAQRVRAVELGSSKKQTDSAEVAALRKRIKELEVR
jgi:hypothetical protein